MPDRDELSQPDPIDDPLGYALWLDLHACTACEGFGEDSEDGEARACPRCGGTGLEPGADDRGGDDR